MNKQEIWQELDNDYASDVNDVDIIRPDEIELVHDYYGDPWDWDGPNPSTTWNAFFPYRGINRQDVKTHDDQDEAELTITPNNITIHYRNDIKNLNCVIKNPNRLNRTEYNQLKQCIADYLTNYYGLDELNKILKNAGLKEQSPYGYDPNNYEDEDDDYDEEEEYEREQLPRVIHTLDGAITSLTYEFRYQRELDPELDSLLDNIDELISDFKVNKGRM